jgi:hypothetical protein
MADHCFNKKKRDKALTKVSKGKKLPAPKVMTEVTRSEQKLRAPARSITF